MERAHEIGKIAEADVISDIGDRAVVVGQPPRRMISAIPIIVQI